MKTKSFQKYLEKRLDKEEIAELRKQAELEIRILKSIQTIISENMSASGHHHARRIYYFD